MEWLWKKPWMVLMRVIIVLVQLQVFGIGSNSGDYFPEEKRSLLDFKAAYSNEHLLPSWGDDPNSNCCDWERVTCDPSSGHITHLSLENVKRIRAIRRESSDSVRLKWSLFLSFKELRSLNLSDNSFGDFIWKGDNRSKSTLKRLETLDLSYNYFNESILELLSGLTSLKNLILSYNHISGLFPSKELSLLQNLEVLDLRFNYLNSALTTQGTRNRAALKRLETLDLGRNQFKEGIMEFLSGLTSLKNLILSDNHISGIFPSKELSLLRNLELLDLSYNALKGPLNGTSRPLLMRVVHRLSDKAL